MASLWALSEIVYVKQLTECWMYTVENQEPNFLTLPLYNPTPFSNGKDLQKDIYTWHHQAP